ncbi:MAG: hypothetical protein RLY43_2091, partial [Bacteroidota bacterium]
MNIVFDIGGTKMRFAEVLGNEIYDPIVVETPNSYIDAMADISDIIFKISKGQKVDCLAG